MSLFAAEIEAYAQAHTTKENELLALLNRETHAKILQPRMLSGHIQGRLLAMIAKLMQPKRILEIGTYTGYSALCLAEGLAEDGILTTIDVNEELEAFTRSFFDKSIYKNQIDYRIGDAKTIIPTLADTYDLVFIDADKPSYALYYDLVFDKVRSGGLIMADNVLWSGKVLNTESKIDKDTRILLDFNQKIKQDSRISSLLLPIRDGLLMMQKH